MTSLVQSAILRAHFEKSVKIRDSQLYKPERVEYRDWHRSAVMRAKYFFNGQLSNNVMINGM